MHTPRSHDRTSETRARTDNEATFLAALAQATEDAIVGEDMEGLIAAWNRGAELLYGYSAAEAIGQPASMLIPRDQRAEADAAAAMEKLRAGEPVRLFESVRLRKDGRGVAVSLTVSPVYLDGSLAGATTIARDVTERRRADEQARAASQYARSLIEASLDPLVTISPEGKITDVNEALTQVTGVARERLIGTDFSDYFTEPQRAYEGCQQVFSQGSVTNYALTIRHRNGRLTNVLYNASVYKNAGGDVVGVFAAAREVSAQKRAEAELAEQRVKEIERLAELERFQKLTVGRELKMIELKKEIEALRLRIAHQEPKA